MSLASCAGTDIGTGTDNTAIEPAEPEPEPLRFDGEIPIELVRYVAGNGSVHDGLPPGFPPFARPESVQVLGSMDFGGSAQAVLTSSASPREAGLQLRQAFLAQEGWRELESRAFARREVFLDPAPASTAGSGPSASGSQGPSAAELSAAAPVIELCHDEHGTLRIVPEGEEGTLELRLDRPGPLPGSWCGQQAQRRARVPLGLANSPAMELLPALHMPAEDYRRAGSGGGFDDWKTSAVLSGEGHSLRSLARHFAPQMEEQGWERDAQWRGDYSAGSTWIHAAEEGRQALGFLEIRELRNGEFEVSFRMNLL